MNQTRTPEEIRMEAENNVRAALQDMAQGMQSSDPREVSDAFHRAGSHLENAYEVVLVPMDIAPMARRLTREIFPDESGAMRVHLRLYEMLVEALARKLWQKRL